MYAFRPEQDFETSTQYVGETKVRFGTRTHEHCFTDKKSSVFKHKQASGLEFSQSDFEILDKGFSKTLDRKLAEALYVKDFKPILNAQKKSYTLMLFN